ncbi:MAG: RNA-binding protein [Pseudonocardiaceae bacterium]|nr:RNA-binding protein [Pseudonocardiaceae bacterium]
MSATPPPAGPAQPDGSGESPPERDGEGAAADPERTDAGVDWSALPDPVRQRLADIAATALPDLPTADLPGPVRPVARFAPAKRGRLGAAALIAALRDSGTFRTAVTEWARSNRPELVDTTVTDRAAAAAAAVLVGEPAAADRVAEMARRADDAHLRSERDAAVARADRLRAERDSLRAELAEANDAAARAGSAVQAEAERLRGRLREQGVRLRQALDEAEHSRAERDAERDELRRRLDSAEAERDRERERADAARRHAERAVADAEAARQAAREARAADEVRLALLVDTLTGAVTGLRRELALTDEPGSTTGPRPADLVRGASPPDPTGSRVEDTAALDRLLALPSVHAIVDGYNVTKTGYPELTLSAQRDRLAGQLAALAARTTAEVSVVFDGAGVVAVPAASPRGVRVLFSDPGVLADDVIRAMVAAEPEGRPVVVVTSDRAVADSVRRRGAHPVPSAVLLARLGRI